MPEIASAASLSLEARLVCADLIIACFDEFYRTLPIENARLRQAIAAELQETGTELEFTDVLMEADHPIGVLTTYPAAEIAARQRAGMFHLLSHVDGEGVDAILDALSEHARSVDPVPEDSLYWARLAIDPAQRGLGNTAPLIERLHMRAANRPITLHVHASNEKAISYHRHYGFAVIPSDATYPVMIAR